MLPNGGGVTVLPKSRGAAHQDIPDGRPVDFDHRAILATDSHGPLMAAAQ
jgi:hypothetical protein